MSSTWVPRKFEELLSESKDGDWGKGEPAEGHIPYHVIRGTDFATVRSGDVSTVPARYLAEKTAWRRTLQAGDILLETAGGSRGRPTGRSLFIDESILTQFPQAITCASFARFLRVDENEADPRFIYWFLQDLYQSGAMWQHQVQHTGVARFQYTRFAETQTVLLPPRFEQCAIAEVLGALDDKITVNGRLCATSLDLAKALYGASDIATSIRLGDVADVFDGPHATPEKTEEGPWFLSISSLKDGFLDLGESAHLAEEDFTRWTRRVQPGAGDVLFSYETRLGSAALMTSGVRGCLGRRMALLRSRFESVSGALILHAYLGPRFQEEIRRRAIHGATVDRIPLKDLPAWPISLPVAEDRAKLSAALESLHSYVAQTFHENQALAELRDTLLPKLMSGEIRVKDAERVVEDAV